jgi:hypothetical protein
MKLFCNGVGGRPVPDMDQRLAPDEEERAMRACAKNGVKQVIEVPVGIDGLR